MDGRLAHAGGRRKLLNPQGFGKAAANDPHGARYALGMAVGDIQCTQCRSMFVRKQPIVRLPQYLILEHFACDRSVIQRHQPASAFCDVVLCFIDLNLSAGNCWGIIHFLDKRFNCDRTNRQNERVVRCDNGRVGDLADGR